MPRPHRSRLQRIGIDIVGFLLIVGAALTGPFPGPGGIPLLIIGLGLLSTNHEWAARLLNYVKRHGIKLSEKLFNGSPSMKLLVDFVGIILIVGAVILVTAFTKSIAVTAAISLVFIGLFLLLGNRKRIDSIKRAFKK